MYYVIDPDNQPHGIVVHATDDRAEAESVAERYGTQTQRRVLVVSETTWIAKHDRHAT